MTIEEWRIRLRWSKEKMAEKAGIDANTHRRAIQGEPIYKITGVRIAKAISDESGQPITYKDLDDVVYYD